MKSGKFQKNIAIRIAIAYNLSKKSIAIQLSMLNLKSIGNMEAIPQKSIANSIAILTTLVIISRQWLSSCID